MYRYILLMTLTPEGREMMVRDSNSVWRAEDEISIRDTQLLGLYGVLGHCDFVGMLEAPDNDAAARFSLELGTRVGMHIATMPAIPISRFEDATRDPLSEGEVGASQTPERESTEEFLRRLEGPPTYGPP